MAYPDNSFKNFGFALAALLLVGGAFYGGLALSVQSFDLRGKLGAPESDVPEPRVRFGDLAYIELPELVVNLRPEASADFLKIAITLAVPADRLAEAQKAEPFVLDMLQDVLRQLDENDVRGSNGLFRLRSEILRRINLLAGEGVVTDVLLRDLLMQ